MKKKEIRRIVNELADIKTCPLCCSSIEENWMFNGICMGCFNKEFNKDVIQGGDKRK